MPGSGALVGEAGFVGRSAELASAASCVGAAAGGDGRVVWVEGDAGSGKTALVDRILERLPDGFAVLRAAADDLATDRPFMVVEQLGAASASDPFAAGLDLLSSFAEAGGERPVAVVVEDLHWADRESRQALLTAARRLDKDRVVLVVTSRPGVAAADGWDRLCSDPSCCLRIVLGGLRQEDVAEMARQAGVALAPRALQRLHGHTGGLALHVRTVLSELTPAQLTAPAGDLPVPRSLASMILARLAGLPAGAQALAGALAVLAKPAPLRVAGHVAGLDRPTEALEALLATGFVTWRPGEAGTTVGFAHPLYRTAVYADLSPTRRQALHRAAAGAVGASSALGHRVAAADGADDELAGELVEAATLAARRGARSLAATYLLWASTLGSGRVGNEERLLRAARLFLDDGQAARSAELRDRLESCGDRPLRSLVLGMLAWEAGEAAVAERWLVEAARSDGRETGDVAAAALGRLGLLYRTQGRPEEAITAGSELLALGGLSDETERSGWSALVAGEAAARGAPAGLDRLARRLPRRGELVPAADTDLLILRGTLGFFAGRTTTAIADMRTAILLARRGAATTELPRCHLQLAQLLLSSGEWDEALVHARLALSLVSDERRVWMEAQAHAALARLFAARGDWDRAGEHVAAGDAAAAWLGTVEAVVTTRIARAALARARHEPARVVEALDPLVADVGSVPMGTSLAWWPTLIGAMVDCGDLDGAGEQVDLLEEAARRRGLDLRARIAGTRAHLESARGHAEEAVSGYTAAVALLDVDDPLLDRAVLHHRFGQLLAARGRRRPALDQLRAAHDLLAGVGADPFVRRVESDLASAGITSRSTSRSPLELTDRERDVAVLVARGLTNREAAAELYISAKAVEYHLGNIFGKLGVASRRELRRRLDD